MWLHREFEIAKPTSYSRKSSPFIDRDFQVRYTILLLGASLLGIILVTAPLLYFFNQNYSIFMELAYDRAPGLLRYLELEKQWLQTLLAAVFLGLITFFSYLGYRMTARIVGPLRVLRNHIKLASRGHWYLDPVKVRDTDEFRDLVESYNYFYRAFQANLRRDLERLNRIQIDPDNRDAYCAWFDLVEEKKAQLHEPNLTYREITLLTGDAESPDHGSQHAS